MEIDYKRFGHQIQACRNAKNISQEQLAELCDLSVSHIAYIENGERHGSVDTIFSIANALEVPVDAFLVGQSDNYVAQYSNAFYDLCADCTRHEAALIYEAGVAFKRTLKEHSFTVNNSRKTPW